MILRQVHMDDSAVEPLCNAIIAQAVKDYTSNDSYKDRNDSLVFFKSNWFEFLSNGMDGEEIVNKLDKKMKLFQERCEEHKPEHWKDAKEAAQCEFSCPFCKGTVRIQWNRGTAGHTYFHQCDFCGVKYSYVFNKKVPPEDKSRQCLHCKHYQKTKSRGTECLLNDIHTTSTSHCEDFEKKE